MYKLILVDDEEEVRKGIIQKIEWSKYGFEIVGEAENGKEALEIAERINPDVVITDIKMPFMDGMKLSEELKSKFPTTKVIILTGFDEFEYAQRAIKLNVIEYVLKPISAQELIDVLLKTKRRIDDEMAQKEDIQALREYYRKSLPILREKFLTTLVTSKLGTEEILEKSSNYDIDISGKCFVVSAVSVDFSSIRASEGQEDALTEASFSAAEDKELVNLLL